MNLLRMCMISDLNTTLSKILPILFRSIGAVTGLPRIVEVVFRVQLTGM